MSAALWPLRLFFLASAVLFGCAAWPRFVNGLAADRALPVPSYMIADITLPKPAYANAASALRETNPANGEARIAGAEAAIIAGASGASQIAALTNGVVATPASARGWTLLAQAWENTDRAKAAASLSQALILAPHDYWVAVMRARMAAHLWRDLDADTQARALDQVRLLWEEPQLRPKILILLSSPGAAQLVTRAFAKRRDELVALNRWVSAERRQSSPSP